MDKIAIFTWCYNNGPVNYGQILQCFALYSVCKKMGYDTKVVKYRRLDSVEDSGSIPKKGLLRDSYEHKHRNEYLQNQDSSQVKAFRTFITENISMTEQCYGKEDILEEISDRNVLIVGSDQLWNPIWFDDVFTLDFVTAGKRRIAYATSGVLSDKDSYVDTYNKIAKEIRGFEEVSVREKRSIEILKKYVDKNIFNALDPVFLLDAFEWEKLINSNNDEEGYVFAFFIGKIEPQKHLIKAIAKKHGVKRIKYIKMDYSRERFNEIDGMIGLCDVGPQMFVELIRNSEAICTDSFHAFAFSVIFQKNFYLMNRAYTNVDEVSNCRWDEIMDKIGIEHRYSNSIKQIVALDSVNYEEPEAKLALLKKESYDWLKKAIEK